MISREELSPQDQRAFDSIVEGLMGHGWTREAAVTQACKLFTPEAEN